jgi:hypothetical protein
MAEGLALVCEGPHDQAVVESLVERVLREEMEWYEGNEDYLRTWCCRGEEPALLWREARERLRLHGGRAARRGLPRDHGDNLAADRAVQVLWFECGRDAHIILFRDCDGQPERRTALEHVQTYYTDRSILIAFAVDRLEAWVLAAFTLEDEEERAALDQERKNLGFDPTARPHELTAQDPPAKRNPKRVVAVLLNKRGNHRETYAEMMRTVAWDHLETDQRGVGCGLLSFREEILQRLVPCFRSYSQRP